MERGVSRKNSLRDEGSAAYERRRQPEFGPRRKIEDRCTGDACSYSVRPGYHPGAADRTHRGFQAWILFD